MITHQDTLKDVKSILSLAKREEMNSTVLVFAYTMRNRINRKHETSRYIPPEVNILKIIDREYEMLN